ncbi:hypothetical protein BVI434_280011 [Burkholderia vietnamiensis]|nr:hypothetical protein BVI434_280011 [Burkholderia vietnamiensis]
MSYTFTKGADIGNDRYDPKLPRFRKRKTIRLWPNGNVKGDIAFTKCVR